MTPSRTLIDLAGSLDSRTFRRAFINAGRSGLLTTRAIEYCLLRGSVFEGHEQLKDLAAQWLPGTGKLRSYLEVNFLLLCGRYGIPAPRTNHRLGRFEADCFWPGTKVVAELDGRTFHDDGFGFEDDREKGNVLAGLGYTVLRFTYRKITDQPDEVARTLREHLVSAG